MRPLRSTALAAAGLAISALAQTAVVTVESSHGGAGTGLRNATVNVPLNTLYTSNDVLDQVSYLFLTDAEEIDVNYVRCQAYMDTAGTSPAGNAFTHSKPAYLSTNTAVVGSLMCRQTTNSTASTTAPMPTGQSPQPTSPNGTTPTTSTSSTTTLNSASRTVSSSTSTAETTESALKTLTQSVAEATSTYLSTTLVPASIGDTTLVPSTITYTSVHSTGVGSSPATMNPTETAAAVSESASSTPRLATSDGSANGSRDQEVAWFGLALTFLFLAIAL